MLTYTDCVKLIGNRESKKLGNNTFLVKLGTGYGIRLHNTDVVIIEQENKTGTKYTIQTGGWNTSTTKDRINKYSPIGVFQSKRQFHINWGGKSFPWDGKAFKFSYAG